MQANPFFYEIKNWPNCNEEWQTEPWHRDKPLGRYVDADIAVVIGTYNRAHLLLRSLFHYQHCQRPIWKYEPRIPGNEQHMSIALVVMDDGSTDFTRELCERFANEQLPIYYFYLGDKQPGAWRDSAAFINKGLSFAIHALGASFIFPTHPEICVGETTISDSVEWLKSNPGFALARGYYLTPEQQESFGFSHSNTKRVLSMKNPHEEYYPSQDFFTDLGILGFISDNPDFYNYGDPTHPYHHSQVEKTPIWHSWIFAGATRETWLRFGGFSESDVWGAIDPSFADRRRNGGFETWTPQDKTAMVVHQNHDDPNQNVVTPRNMELCMATISGFDATPEQPGLLNPERWK